MAKGDPSNIDELLQTLAVQNTEDLSFTETIRPNTPLTNEQLIPSSLPRRSLSPEDNPASDLELLGILGEGGMGQVQLARQHSLKREVALKRLKATRKTTGNVHSLLEEARRTGMLEHPNIIPVHAVG